MKQPTGEDFFLAAVQIDTPADPCWDDSFNIIGNWKAVSPTISLYLVCNPRAHRSHVRVYQGDEARHFFVASVREELRYQEQKRALQNN